MQQLLAFIYNNRAFFVFLGLQLLATWLIVNHNTYQNFAFLSSSNAVTGKVDNMTSAVSGYFRLGAVNDSLQNEVARLRKQLNSGNLGSQPTHQTLFNSYQYEPAKVINNSIRLENNYLTLDKGRKHGIEPGMGVITSNGIVGKVKASSQNFSAIYSLLHSDMIVAAELKKNGTICTAKWLAPDFTKAQLLYLSRQAKLSIGDTIVTSSSNAVFPPNVMIGTISSFEKPKSERFMVAEIDLSTDFASLDYVYIVKNRFAAEKDSLENAVVE